MFSSNLTNLVTLLVPLADDGQPYLVDTNCVFQYIKMSIMEHRISMSIDIFPSKFHFDIQHFIPLHHHQELIYRFLYLSINSRQKLPI